MEGNADETEQREIRKNLRRLELKFLSEDDKRSQNDNSHCKTQPDHRGGGDVPQGYFGGNEGGAPDGDGKDSLEKP